MADPTSRPPRNPDGSYAADFVHRLIKLLEEKNHQLADVNERLTILESNNSNNNRVKTDDTTDNDNDSSNPFTDTTTFDSDESSNITKQ